MPLYDIPCMYFFILCSFASATTLSSASLVGPFLLPQIVSPYAVMSNHIYSITLSCYYCPRKVFCSPRFIFYFHDIHTLTLMETLKYISARRLIQGTTMYLLFCRTVTSPLVLLHSSACHCSC